MGRLLRMRLSQMLFSVHWKVKATIHHRCLQNIGTTPAIAPVCPSTALVALSLSKGDRRLPPRCIGALQKMNVTLFCNPHYVPRTDEAPKSRAALPIAEASRGLCILTLLDSESCCRAAETLLELRRPCRSCSCGSPSLELTRAAVRK
jgi:hypothetical protein